MRSCSSRFRGRLLRLNHLARSCAMSAVFLELRAFFGAWRRCLLSSIPYRKDGRLAPFRAQCITNCYEVTLREEMLQDRNSDCLTIISVLLCFQDYVFFLSNPLKKSKLLLSLCNSHLLPVLLPSRFNSSATSNPQSRVIPFSLALAPPSASNVTT